MPGKTATETTWEEQQKRVEDAQLHDRAEWFFRQWAPEGDREKAEFHADLLTLIHQIYATAQAPLIKQMSAALALVPFPPLMRPAPASQHTAPPEAFSDRPKGV